MCGFLGEISSSLLTEKKFKDLLDLSRQRGPNQQTIWSDSICQLGFNRLAILDTSSAGMQPVKSPSGRFYMVLNGEIYNYKSLQLEHGILDSELRSSSDVEVVSQLLDKVSILDLVTSLNGMFAIAIWDTRFQKLYLIRDFAGIKPLYYGEKENQLIFASQFDQIFKHPLFYSKRLRPEAMKTFFGFGYMHAPDTVFEFIYQVEPGQMIVWDYAKKSIVEKMYYYQWETSETLLDSAFSTKEKFKNIIHEAVKKQLQSDVPLASFLSSGVDSAIISAFAKKEYQNLTAFTFGISSHGKYDEREDASKYATYLNLNHIIATAKEADLISQIDAHFKAMPEPFGDYSSLPTYLITQKARMHATVMLGGDGGDELFWGYPRFRKSLHQAHWFRYPLWLRKLIIPFYRKKKPKLSYALERLRRFDAWIMEKQMHFTDIDSFMPNTYYTASLYKCYEYKSKLEKSNILQYLKKNEFYGHMQRTLKKIDLCSMAHGLEVRVPYLDKDVIAFSNMIKSEFTVTHDFAKIVPKEALYDLIPLELLNTEKKGFSVPIAHWLKHELKEDFKKTVLDTPIYGAAYLDHVILKKMVANFYDNKLKVDTWGLWHVYAWQKWALHHGLIEYKNKK